MKVHRGPDGMDYDCLTATLGCKGECGGVVSAHDIEKIIADIIERVQTEQRGYADSDDVACVIVAELGLYEERRLNAMSSGGMSTNYKTGVTTSHSDYRYDHRYLTAWMAEEKK